ncbi:rRNA small subunit 7-methylguanosine methyltransferase GidB [Lachnospiraceae bacterium KM106-2]|nr:rRNA small subunit 7-methylguanosine methyltransferase GidB [Lachnospiraceae bacterium KM106-2]
MGNDKFKNGIDRLNIDLSEKQLEQFQKYYEMLIEWNKVMNLTAITEYDDVIEKHFLDSLLLAQVIDLKKDYYILDLGTGAGFPGIPLKIAFPHLKIVLADSLNKRIKFLNEVIRELGLEDIEAVHGRAEEMAKKSEYREQFDLCVSRAVANLSTLSEYCIPFVKRNGYFIPYKSGKIQEEMINGEVAIKVLGGKILDMPSLTIPNTDMERNFVVVKKEKSTPKKYPRSAGKPSKEPISK